MRRPRFRLSVRALVELVALAAVALGFRSIWRETQPPGPSVDALRRGDEARRVAALRDLSLLGTAGVEAIPDLVRASRADPSPAVRRGAVHALTMIALEDGEEDLVLDAVLAGPRAAGPPPRPAPARGAGQPLLRPGGDRAALDLVEVMRADPDPSVRVYALRALRKVLNAADIERRRARAKARTGGPAPAYVSAGPWVELSARALAELTRDAHPEVRGQAAGFLVGSHAGKALLSKDEQLAILWPLVREDAPRLPTGLDITVLAHVAHLMGPGHPDSPRLIDLLTRRRADPPLTADVRGRGEGMARHARAGYDRILWSLAGSAEILRMHPEMTEILGAMLSGDPDVYRQAAFGGEALVDQAVRLTANRYESRPEGSSSWSGSPVVLPEPRTFAMKAIARDPRLLGLLWPRVDRPGRRGWLASEPLPRSVSWETLFPRLADPRVRPDLPPEESAAILGRLLDESGPADEDAPKALERLVNRAERDRRGRDPRDSTTPPVEAARQVHTLRNLAVLAYFARGAGPGGRSVGRLADRLRDLLGSPESQVRRGAAELLGSLGAAAEAAEAELRAQADRDDDEEARSAAGEALRAIRGSEPAGRGQERRDADP